MNHDQERVELHMTPQARERRTRLAEAFDRAATTPEQAFEEAQAMLEELKRHPGYRPAPGKTSSSVD